jgi:hypothetical protein
MNTSLKTRFARCTASIAAASMITFTGLQLICNYALPPQSEKAPLTVASVSAATGAAPAAPTR